MRTVSRTLAALSGLTLVSCVHYRYDFSPDAGPASRPADGMPTEVVTDRDLVVPALPARLRLREYDERCVLLIENPTDAEITLDGPASAIVDPLGQTRAVATQLIPPGAFTKLILPPLREIAPSGPTIGFGFGYVAAGDAPRRAQLLDVGRAQDYWEWDGPGKVRVVIGLKQNGQNFRHAFVLARSKE